MISLLKKILPKSLVTRLLPTYHSLLANLSAIKNGHPSKKLHVIGITGTKGKSSTAEIVHRILLDAGYKTALISTIRFAIGEETEPNLFKMTMPGRFFVQDYLNKAVKEDCTHAVVEMTSEGVKQSRHKNIHLNTLVFTNLSPEHIESHGSFENYKNAKLELRDALAASVKKSKNMIVNMDDEHGEDFIDVDVKNRISFSTKEISNELATPRITFTYNGEHYTSPLQGTFNIYNILAAIKVSETLDINSESVRTSLANLNVIPGRVEYVEGGQSFGVVVDYAHTIDSLSKFYDSFENKKKICILGNTGGGRDTWKRPKMAELAEDRCDTVILTDEDPYDEDPQQIIDEMAAGMKSKPIMELDRRLAMRKAFQMADKDSVVLITGKGTDPYIMRAGGDKEPWSDKQIALEELQKLS